MKHFAINILSLHFLVGLFILSYHSNASAELVPRMKPGSVMTYTRVEGGSSEILSRAVTGTKNINGKTWLVVKLSGDSVESYYRYDGDGFYSYSDHTGWIPERLMFKNSPQTGGSFKHNYGKVEVKTTILGSWTGQVPAGNYSCTIYRIEYDYSDSPGTECVNNGVTIYKEFIGDKGLVRLELMAYKP